MNNNEYDILLAIVENTDMALHSTEVLVNSKKVTDSEFISLLKEHSEKYKEINSAAAQAIIASGNKVETKGKINKAMSKVGINMELLMNHSVSHVAEMLIQGSTMGLIDATREINSKRGSVNNDSVALADKMLHNLEENINTYKKYL